MRVGLNLVYLVPGETGGMETYARELIPRLASLGDLDLVAFVNREAAAAGAGPWHDIEHEVVPVRARNRLEWVRGEQQHVPRLARRHRCEVVHSLASTAPLRGSFARVTTIHDLHYLVQPDAHFGARGLGMRVLVPLAMRRSRRVIVPSRSTRDDLVTRLRAEPARIDVVPEGVGLAPRPRPGAAAAARERLALGERPLLLTVSAKRPHKNLMRLLAALARIPAERRPVLVLPGYRTPHAEELEQRARELGLDRDVRFLDWVSEEELEGLYAAAACFVFPSLYEGFGLPVLEAMARGVPVASSDRGSLAEVVGDAGLIFDPEDEAAIAGAIERVLSDADLAERLRAAGRARAATFSWDEAARGTFASYGRALSEP
jgi:glycosyltransferase involved in cell wall biosynthesis